MIYSNSRYITMHLDRLNEELLEEYGKNIEDKSQKKQTRNKTEMNIEGNHGF